MITLFQRLFAREEKPKVETQLSADEIKPLFEKLGINIETIGFPSIETRHKNPLDRYNITFDKIKITPKKIDDNFTIIVTGKYITKPQASRYHSGTWIPGDPTVYSFEIKDNKLNIK